MILVLWVAQWLISTLVCDAQTDLRCFRSCSLHLRACVHVCMQIVSLNLLFRLARDFKGSVIPGF